MRHGPILDIRARPIRGLSGVCPPARAAAPPAPNGVVAWSCTDGYLVFLACSISERLLGVTGSIGWHGSISLVVPVP